MLTLKTWRYFRRTDDATPTGLANAAAIAAALAVIQASNDAVEALVF